MKYQNINDNIKNRNNIFYIVVVSILILLICYKIIFNPIDINIENFSFTDFITLLIAFFAIALSIAFYFKATETSNKFYDNSYKFTKNMSEILGRIEAGFGERLSNLDKGYTGILNKIDNLPLDKEISKNDLNKNKQEVEQKEKEKDKMLNEILSKSKIEEKERKNLFNKLKSLEKELLYARNDLIHKEEKYENSKLLSKFCEEELYTLQKELHRIFPNLILKHSSNIEIRMYFDQFKDNFSKNFLKILFEHNLIGENLHLNEIGVKVFKAIY